MTLSYIKIDYDIVDKIQALLDKYEIDFNYRKNVIDKLVNYAETYHGLSDALNNYKYIDQNNENMFSINWKCCKKWNRIIKNLGLHVNDEEVGVINLSNGWICSVNSICPVNVILRTNIKNFLIDKEVFFTFNYNRVDSLKELEDKLENIDSIVNEYVNFSRARQTYDKYLNLLKQCTDKFNTEQEVYESSLNKITNGLLKLVDIENEK